MKPTERINYPSSLPIQNIKSPLLCEYATRRMATQSSRTTSGLGQGQLGDDYVAMVVKAGTVGFDT